MTASAPRDRFVVLDGATLDPGDNPWDEVARLGELEVHPRTAPQDVVARAFGARVVLTNKTVLDRDAFAALEGLELVCVLATGVNVVDVEAAAAQGVTVCNVPEYSSDSVAQHVFALLLELVAGVGELDAAVRDGEWARCEDFSFWKRPLRELAGSTMGIVGHGRIGSRVGELALAFGMDVLAFSPSRSRAGRAPGFQWATIEEIFAGADVVSLHCPLTADNARFVDSGLLASMKPGALFLNTSRGGLVDEQALASALRRGVPSAAALDVLSVEPPPADHPLVGLPNCLVTPHVAWSTLAARRRLMAVTAANVRAFLQGRPQNVVVAPRSGATTWRTP